MPRPLNGVDILFSLGLKDGYKRSKHAHGKDRKREKADF
jgi:hypothetical protein